MRPGELEAVARDLLDVDSKVVLEVGLVLDVISGSGEICHGSAD